MLSFEASRCFKKCQANPNCSWTFAFEICVPIMGRVYCSNMRALSGKLAGKLTKQKALHPHLWCNQLNIHSTLKQIWLNIFTQSGLHLNGRVKKFKSRARWNEGMLWNWIVTTEDVNVKPFPLLLWEGRNIWHFANTQLPDWYFSLLGGSSNPLCGGQSVKLSDDISNVLKFQSIFNWVMTFSKC